MGCCISKCKPKTKPQLNPNVGHVQDKLVISHSPPSTPPSPSPPRKRKTAQSPPSVTNISFASSTQSSTCGSSSLSSASSASSIAFSKVDRTFSNDFLQSCALDNPQIVGFDPIKKIGVVKQLSPGLTTHKRARAMSPTLTRQKSFRVENGRISTMRSPSPSRRFNQNASNYQRQPMMFSMNTRNESINRVVRANTRPASPNRNVISNERPIFVKNKERFGCEIGSKVEGVEVAQVLSRMSYSGSAPMEDLDNPHIALDCFIFL